MSNWTAPIFVTSGSNRDSRRPGEGPPPEIAPSSHSASRASMKSEREPLVRSSCRGTVDQGEGCKAILIQRWCLFHPQRATISSASIWRNIPTLSTARSDHRCSRRRALVNAGRDQRVAHPCPDESTQAIPFCSAGGAVEELCRLVQRGPKSRSKRVQLKITGFRPMKISLLLVASARALADRATAERDRLLPSPIGGRPVYTAPASPSGARRPCDRGGFRRCGRASKRVVGQGRQQRRRLLRTWYISGWNTVHHLRMGELGRQQGRAGPRRLHGYINVVIAPDIPTTLLSQR